MSGVKRHCDRNRGKDGGSRGRSVRTRQEWVEPGEHGPQPARGQRHLPFVSVLHVCHCHTSEATGGHAGLQGHCVNNPAVSPQGCFLCSFGLLRMGTCSEVGLLVVLWTETCALDSELMGPWRSGCTWKVCDSFVQIKKSCVCLPYAFSFFFPFLFSLFSAILRGVVHFSSFSQKFYFLLQL